jgi:hypothetical protein
VRLRRPTLGKTKKGREVSTLVVETVEPGAAEGDKAGKKLPVSAVNALSALRYALDEVGAIPPASNHIPAGQKCVSVSQWREYAYARSGHALPDSKLKDFVRGCDKLHAEVNVGIFGAYAWLAK